MAGTATIERTDSATEDLTDPTLALARAVIAAERIYELAAEANHDQIRGQSLLLMAHLKIARKFAS